MGRRSIVRVVDRGRVWCPQAQADVDVENCYSCQYLTRVSDEGQSPTGRSDESRTLACRAPVSVVRQFGY